MRRWCQWRRRLLLAGTAAAGNRRQVTVISWQPSACLRKIRAWRPLATQLLYRDMNSADRRWALNPLRTMLAHVGPHWEGEHGQLRCCGVPSAPQPALTTRLRPHRGGRQGGGLVRGGQVECGQVIGCEAPTAPAPA
jgi:hypothetical protein